MVIHCERAKKHAKIAKRMTAAAQKHAQQNMLGARKLQQAKEALTWQWQVPAKPDA